MNQNYLVYVLLVIIFYGCSSIDKNTKSDKETEVESENYIPDLIIHLRPTYPIRSVKIVDKAIKFALKNRNFDCIRSVCEPTQNPYKMWKKQDDGYLRPLIEIEIKESYNSPRQNLPDVYWQNGYIDIIRTTTIINKKSMTGDMILPLIVDSKHIIDIDDELTFKLAEMIYLSSKER